MHVERERRYRVAGDRQHTGLAESFRRCAPVQQVDFTLGPSGPCSMEQHGWVLRVRKQDDDLELQFKGRTAVRTDSMELAVGVDSVGNAIGIATAVGMRPGLLLRKQRRELRLAESTAALDVVEHLGTFVEIEAAGEFDGILDTLDITGAEEETLAYGDLLLARLRSEPDFVRRYRDEMVAYLAEHGVEPGTADLWLESHFR